MQAQRKARRSNPRGQGLVEYALLLVLVGVVVIVILAVLGDRVGNVYCNVATQLNRSQPAACAPAVANNNGNGNGNSNGNGNGNSNGNGNGG